MKAYVLIRIKQGTPEITKAGDIIEIYPITGNDNDMGTDTRNDFLPLVMNIAIPCGDGAIDAAGKWGINKRGPTFQCGSCKYNDPDLCERIKYLKAEWGGGTLETPPKVVRKRMHYIDRSGFTTSQFESFITKVDKTEVEKSAMMAFAKANEMPKSIIRLK